MNIIKQGIIYLVFLICLTATFAFGQMIVKSSTDVDLMTVNDNGDVVIGTSSNNGALTLHGNETINGALTVSGLTTTTTLKITDGAAAGTILMSDADGDASWNSLTTLVDDNTIKVNASNQLYADVSFTDTDNQNLGVGAGDEASAVLTIEGGNNVTFTAGSRISISESPTNRTITIAATNQQPLSGNAIVITNDREVNHEDTSEQIDSDNSGRTVIQDITLDEYGHITDLGTTTLADNVNDADHSTTNELQNLNQVLSRGNNANGQNAVNFNRIGINTTSPSTSLHVIGNIMVGAHTTARPDGRSIVFGSGTQAWIGSEGTSSNFPRSHLHISGHGNTSSQDRFVSLMDNVNIGYSLYMGTGSSIANAYTTYGHDHAIHHWSGAHLTNSGAWVNASSRKNKDNIQNLDLHDAYSALDQLDPVTFTYKIEPDEKQVGFIAEDVPELVAINDRTGVSTIDIVGVLTKVVKDQEKRIKQLENMLNR
jgi:hypothetical protein